MIARSDVAAVILAGGKAQRSGGRIKSLVEVEGRVVVERQMAVLKPKVATIEIAVSAPAPWARVPTIIDDHVDVGPLAGIAAALAHPSRDWTFVVGGDQAWLSPDVIDLLLARAGDPFDVVAVRFDYATPKPLFALYHKRCAAKAIARIERGEHDAAGLLGNEGMAVRWIEDYEVQSLDPELATFRTVE